MSKNQPTYAQDFKQKVAELRDSGRSLAELSREYGMSKGTISTWHKQYKNSGSFKTSDNLSEDEKELRRLRKENKRLHMEVDILKQAALIMARNDE